MKDQAKWEVAWNLFKAYLPNLPATFDQERVNQYHTHVAALESASGLSLNEFRIPPEEMKPRAEGWRPRGYSGAPGSIRYGGKKYCATNYAIHKIQALYRYLQDWESQSRKGAPSASKDYWSMGDQELERLAYKYHIPAWGRAGEHGEHWFVDRTSIITELVRRDAALRAGEPASQSSIIHVNEMRDSVIQQGSPGAVASLSFQPSDTRVTPLLQSIKSAATQLDLSPAAKSQIDSDIGTVELQITSPHPKSAVIVESLRSIRSILEGTTGSLIAAGIALEIAKLLGAN